MAVRKYLSMINFRYIKILSLLWIGSFAGAGLAFFTQIVLARGLSADEYGSFASALTIVTLLGPLAGFGIPALWLRVFGSEGWGGVRWIRPSFCFILGTTTAVIILAVVWAYIGGHEDRTRYLIIILTAFIVGQLVIELVSSKLQLEENFVKLSFWQVSPHVLRFLLIFFVYVACSGSLTPLMVGIVYASVALAFLCFSVAPLSKMLRGEIALVGHNNSRFSECSKHLNWRDVANTAWPFGVGSFAYLIYFQSDIILLKYLVSDEAAGRYNVAFSILSAVYLLPSVLYQKFLMPKIHRWASYDHNKFRSVYKKGNRAMFAFGVLALLGVWVVGDDLVNILFGDAYSGSVALLYILIFSAPLISVALSAGSVLVTKDGMREKVKYMLMVAALNMIMNFIAIPIWAEKGAAVTTVISNGVLLLLYFYGAERKFQRGERCND